MLQILDQDDQQQVEQTEASPFEGGLDLVNALRRNVLTIVSCVVLAFGIGVAIIALSEPTYVANARILFDPQRVASSRQGGDRDLAQYVVDTSQLENQIQLLKSEQVSRQVIETHGLDQDPELTRPGFSVGAVVKSLLASQSVSVNEPTPTLYNALSNAFDSRLDVRRVGQSYVLMVSYRSTDPLKAAKLANAVTAAYIARQVLSRIDNAKRSSQFERPIKELNDEGATVLEAIKTGVIDINVFPAADARVISAALPPTGPSAPRSSLILALAMALGLAAGSVLAVTRHNLRKAVLTRSHVERHLDLFYLGSLGQQQAGFSVWRRPRLHAIDGWAAELFREKPSRKVMTQLRTIRTSFEMATSQRGGPCIAVTSARRGEGKSLLAFGLAVAFAMAGRKTLLIDANVRNPTLSKHLGVPARIGLAEVLAGALPADAISPTGAGSLFFMGVGDDGEQTSFSDHFASVTTQDIFRRLHQKFDRIVIDLPDFSTVPDAWAICPLIDSYVLVVEAGVTRLGEVALMASKIRPVNIAGVVLNNRSL